MQEQQLTLDQTIALYIRSLAGRNTSSLTTLAYNTDLTQFISWIKENDTTVVSPLQIERTHITDYLTYQEDPMPHDQHHTVPALDEQLQAVINQGWEQEVLAQLPADAERQAERLGAFVRQRQIKGVSDLLRALLAYVLCAGSFRHLGSWAVRIGLANLSHVAWRKRLRQARAWLLWLLCELLAVTVPSGSQGHESRQRIVLIDGSRLKEPGGSGDDWRVHLGYDLLAGRLVDVRVADRHTAEAFELFVVGPGDVLVADRGYSRRRKSGLCAQARGRRGGASSGPTSAPAR